jgi:hypothetical protein
MARDKIIHFAVTLDIEAQEFDSAQVCDSADVM